MSHTFCSSPNSSASCTSPSKQPFLAPGRFAAKQSSVTGLHLRCRSRPQWQTAAYSDYTGFKPGQDRALSIKISLAKISGSLDLSWLGLESLDPEIFQLTDLEELTIAGNRLQELPEDICKLANLKKLQAAGNLLHDLPDSFTQLTSLQGIWLHGNVLQKLPDDIGALSNLKTLSLAGNCIQRLPESISQLTDLKELTISGNALQELPSGIGRLKNLVTLSLNGNALASLPKEIGDCAALQNLHLQYNELTFVPQTVTDLKSLVELNLSDNSLEGLPGQWNGLQQCASIWMYGNRLRHLPEGLLTAANLECAWVENNPLDAGHLAEQLSGVNPASKLREVGLDDDQVSSLEAHGVAITQKSYIKSGKVAQGKKGYLKLRHAAHSLFTEAQAAKVLVITFASAPGTPNWGGLLGKYVAQASPEESNFDILYVCDGSRGWYSAGNEEFGYWEASIQAVSRKYEEVIMLGDSMGASAALLFSHLASSVQAFTPQVDLANASIRPGRSQEWLTKGKQRILQSVNTSSAKILVHSGTWDHDLEQVCQSFPFTRSLA